MERYWECTVFDEVCSVCNKDCATYVLQTIWQSNYSNIGLFGGNIGLFGRNTGLFLRYRGNALVAMRTVLRVFCKESGKQICSSGLISGNTGRFCRNVGLFGGNIGLFGGNTGLF